MKYILMIAMLFPSFCLAELPVDKVTHFAVSYTINHGLYSTCVILASNDEKLPCLIASTLVTTGVGLLKEYSDRHVNSKKESGKDMLFNGLGMAFSTTFIVLKW